MTAPDAGAVPAPGSDAARRALIIAFVDGAKWWEWYCKHATMWASDRALAEAEAARRYPGPELYDPADPLDNLTLRPRQPVPATKE